jgi:hypothetical protein
MVDGLSAFFGGSLSGATIDIERSARRDRNVRMTRPPHGIGADAATFAMNRHCYVRREKMLGDDELQQWHGSRSCIRSRSKCSTGWMKNSTVKPFQRAHRDGGN